MQEYAIEIVEVARQSSPAQRSMVLRVTDERLLQKTGGIVQGMSGAGWAAHRGCGACVRASMRNMCLFLSIKRVFRKKSPQNALLLQRFSPSVFATEQVFPVKRVCPAEKTEIFR